MGYGVEIDLPPLSFNERTIQLTHGYMAIVDAADYEMLTDMGMWHAQQSRSKVYAARVERTPAGKKKVYMHRVVSGAGEGHVVDHQNGVGLDNRRNNLRLCGFDQNAHYAPYKSTGKYRGVQPAGRRWRAKITIQGTQVHLGMFDTAEEAALAYDKAAGVHYGRFAWKNFSENLTPAGTEALENIPF